MTSTDAKIKLSLVEFLELPETKPASEYIEGKVYQKPMPGGKHSLLRTRLLAAINQVGKSQKIAYAFPELSGTFGGSSVVPDIAVFEWQRIPVDSNGEVEDWFEIPPDWVIEIHSLEQSLSHVIRKIIFCLNQGTKLGWLIDPEDESIIIFQLNRLPSVKSNLDSLPVLEVLGDGKLCVVDVFDWLQL